MSANIDIVIPARYASTRFPGKALALIDGKPMIEHVYKRAKQSKLARSVIVATDDDRIAKVVKSFDGQFIMTKATHNTGTDRLSEVASKIDDCQIIANVQGDEPLIDPESIDSAIQPLVEDSKVEMSTIAYPLVEKEAIEDPQIVKVVLDKKGFALYFSRYPIPYYRDEEDSSNGERLGHAGLYVYRKETLLKLASLPQTDLEKKEKLEQLRALENGINIKVVVRAHESPGVDVPQDVDKILALMKKTNVTAIN